MPEHVIGVVVGEEDFLKANPTPYRIIWRWVPSPQSNRSVSPFPLHREAGDVAIDGRNGGAGAQEGEGEHVGKIQRGAGTAKKTFRRRLEQLDRHRHLPRMLLHSSSSSFMVRDRSRMS